MLGRALGCSRPTVRRVLDGGRPSYKVARAVDKLWEEECANVSGP